MQTHDGIFLAVRCARCGNRNDHPQDSFRTGSSRDVESLHRRLGGRARLASSLERSSLSAEAGAAVTPVRGGQKLDGCLQGRNRLCGSRALASRRRAASPDTQRCRTSHARSMPS
jgi:ribosomal protein S27E